MFDTQAREYAEMLIGQMPEGAARQARAHLERFMRTYSACPIQPGARILDLGAGTFYCNMLQHLKGYEIESIPGLTYDFEADRFPFDDGVFDGVLLCEVLEHFTEDPMHCLIEINRITKPNGFFVLTVPNCASWYSIYNALQQYHPSRYAHYYTGKKGSHSLHAREYLASEVFRMFGAAGFSVGLIDTFNYNGNQWPPIPGFSTDNRGETIICVGRKKGPPRLRFIKECYGGVDVPFTEANRYKSAT